MALNFDEIPSVADLTPPEELQQNELPTQQNLLLAQQKLPDECEKDIPQQKKEDLQNRTVSSEIESARRQLIKRTTKCESIQPLYTRSRIRPHKLAYKFICICPRYRPHYCCKHVGNIVVDRDMLTKEEHICYLASPKRSFGAKRFMPRFYHRRVIVPDCTARIERLAQPDVRRVKDTIEGFHHILKRRQVRALQKQLKPKTNIQSMKLQTALAYIEEEKRLQRAKKNVEIRRCKKIKKRIALKQRKQIQKIICFLFEEMKDILLNDQFLIDDNSTLSAVLIDQIKEFTDKDFFTTTNLRQYQHILANNLTVWINKFISNLDIHVAPPPKPADRPGPDAFLPLQDYISVSEPICDEGQSADEDHVPHEGEEGYGAYPHAYITGDTVKG